MPPHALLQRPFSVNWPRRVALCGIVVWALAAALPAHADSQNVGLGVAVGAAYSPTHVFKNDLFEPIGTSFSWGFFVDVPLVDTFYLSPAAMLYRLDLGQGAKPATDIDLNFKFLLPIGPVRLGPGVIVGLSAVELAYLLHVGAMAHFSLSLLPNLDVFVLAQYKRVFRDQTSLNNLHGYAGVMFRF